MMNKIRDVRCGKESFRSLEPPLTNCVCVWWYLVQEQGCAYVSEWVGGVKEVVGVGGGGEGACGSLHCFLATTKLLTVDVSATER